MARLSEFSFNNKNENKQKKVEQVSQEKLQETYNKYKNYSQSELFSTLMHEVEKQKRDGTFDFSQLENMVNSLQSSLPPENFENIKRILERLK